MSALSDSASLSVTPASSNNSASCQPSRALISIRKGDRTNMTQISNSSPASSLPAQAPGMAQTAQASSPPVPCGNYNLVGEGKEGGEGEGERRGKPYLLTVMPISKVASSAKVTALNSPHLSPSKPGWKGVLSSENHALCTKCHPSSTVLPLI